MFTWAGQLGETGKKRKEERERERKEKEEKKKRGGGGGAAPNETFKPSVSTAL